MKMMTKAMKGISFLLCLGFLTIATNNAWAATSDPINTDKLKVDKIKKDNDKNYRDLQEKISKLESNCDAATKAVSSFGSKANAYVSAAESLNSAIDAVTSACNKYSKIKTEYNSCLSGGKGIDVSAARNAQKAADNAKAAMESALAEAKASLSSCKDTSKEADKTDKAADKAENKEQKALDKMTNKTGCSEEEVKSGACLKKFQDAYNNCGDDPKVCKDAYKALQKAEDLQDDYNDAAGKAKVARTAANDAEKARLDAQCPGSMVWNKDTNACVVPGATQEDIEKCGGTGYFYAKSGIDYSVAGSEGQCYTTASERDAAKEADKQKAMEEAQKAYEDCMATVGTEDPAACSTEELRIKELGSLAASDNATGATDREVQDAISSLTNRCAGVSKTGEAHGTFGIFDYLACKITTVVADLRVIVYILAGFGMIAFAYGAIIGKIQFKQLANIAIGLFILSMTTGIIEEIVFNDGTSHLQYGDFLPNGNHEQYFQTTSNCSTNRELCPDYSLAADEEAAKTSKWGSWDDIKTAIKTGKEAIETTKNTYDTVKATVDSGIKAAERIGDAIENGGNPFDVVAEIAGDVNQIVVDANLAATTLGNAANTIANDVRDGTSTEEQRQYRENLQNQYDILKAKCGTGNCSQNELDSLAALEQKVGENQTGVNAWLNNEGAGGGATILSGIGNVAEITSGISSTATAAQAGKNEGQSIGGDNALGDTLGVLFGLGNAVDAGTDEYKGLEERGALDFRSEETKVEETKAQALAAARSSCSAAGGSYNESTGKCTRSDGADIDTATGAATVKNPDGSTTTTLKNQDGSTTTTVKAADGTTRTTTVNPDGSSVTVAKQGGHTVVITKDEDGKTTEATVDGMSAEHQECITTRGGKWNNEKKQCEGMTKTADGCQNGWVRYNGNCVSEEAKKQAEEAERLQKAQAECAKKADYEWKDNKCVKVEKNEESKDEGESKAGKSCSVNGKTGVWNKDGTGCCFNGLDANGYCAKNTPSQTSLTTGNSQADEKVKNTLENFTDTTGDGAGSLSDFLNSGQ